MGYSLRQPNFLLAFLILHSFATLALGDVIQSMVVLYTNESGGKYAGTLTFTQDNPNSSLIITGNVSGLLPPFPRGMHIHQFGNLTAGCDSTGTHFNRLGKPHGGPQTNERHNGDLGNIEPNNEGVATINLSIDPAFLSLSGPNAISGRALVVHNGTDDLGLGNSSTLQLPGNPTKRLACGVIGISKET